MEPEVRRGLAERRLEHDVVDIEEKHRRRTKDEVETIVVGLFIFHRSRGRLTADSMTENLEQA
jgi:hypothetical protein